MAAISWKTGTSGNWSQASNWSSGTVPNGGDSVTINAAGTYTVTVDAGFFVNSLTFDAPAATIAIASGDRLTSGGATITGGEIDGPGTLANGGGVWTIAASAPLTLGGGLTLQILSVGNGSVVNDAGTINIGDAAGLTATILNQDTFNLTTDTAGIGLNSVNVGGSLQSGSGNFQNFGTLAKTGGTGTSHVFASYSGSGIISVSAGTLEFEGPSNTFNGGTISGTGTIAFGAGSSQFSVNPTTSNFLIDGGSVSFSNTLTYAGNFAETGGSLALNGNASFSGTFALSGGALNFNSGNTLTLPTTTSFAGGTVTGGTVAINGNATIIGGTTVIQAAVANNGTIAANAGTLDLGGAVSGNGQETISSGARVEFGQASAATQKVNFAGLGTLKIDQPSLFKSPIAGFQRGDAIDLAGVTATSAVYSGGNLRLFNGATPVFQVTVSTPYSQPIFGLASDKPAEPS
jgi:hypothetical protein